MSFFLQDIPSVKFGKHFKNNNNPEIVENDSIIITSDKSLETFDCLEVAEFSIKSIVLSSSLGEMVSINDTQVEELRKKWHKSSCC